MNPEVEPLPPLIDETALRGLVTWVYAAIFAAGLAVGILLTAVWMAS